MWDTVESSQGPGRWSDRDAVTEHLSHDRPCPRCGHAVHTYLACSDTCDCVPVGVPGLLAG